MTKKQLFNLGDRVIAHLNREGQPSTLILSESTFNKLDLSAAISESELKDLYLFLTSKTGLCQDAPSSLGGRVILLSGFGLMVVRDFGTYSKYVRSKLYQRLWRGFEALVLISTFVLICIGALKDNYFEYFLQQIHGEQQQEKAQPTIEKLEYEEFQANSVTKKVVDSSNLQVFPSDSTKSKQPSLPVQD